MVTNIIHIKNLKKTVSGEEVKPGG